MKSTDERMAEVFGRTRMREATVRRRKQRTVALGGCVLSVVVVVVVGVGISSVADPAGVAGSAGQLGLMGSVLAGGSALGYVVVGLLGFVLGAAVTAVAYRLGHHPQAAEDSRNAPVDHTVNRDDEGRQP